MAKGWAVAAMGVALAAVLATCQLRDAGLPEAAAAQDAVGDAHLARPGSVSREHDRRDATTLHTPSIAMSPDLLEAWSRAQRDSILRLVRELVARGDAESLLDAALLLPMACDGSGDCQAESAERARLLAAAARLAPDHPLIAFLQTEACFATGDCAAAYQRLAVVDPDNLFAHLGVMQVAARAGDPAALDRALRAAAAAPLYDAYSAELTTALERALHRLPTPSAAVRAQLAEALGLRGALDEDSARLLQVLVVSAAMGFPPLQALLQTCRVDSVQRMPAHRTPCLAVLARMAASDTTLARSVGLTRLVELTAGTAAGAQWRERLREFAWVQERFLALQHSMGVVDLRLQAEQGEWVAMRAMLHRHGVPLQPPNGWLPAQQQYRQLLSGRG